MEDGKLRCLFCGGELIWSSDFNLEEVCGFAEEGDGGIASYYTCSTCGRTYEICDPPEEERKTSYKEYWNED